ncbi:MAG: LysM peptidoglycan-binding domain-containing protein [Chloroflexota bacterium]
MNRYAKIFILTVVSAGWLAACATVQQEKPAAYEQLAVPHREKAAMLAAEGKLRAALESYKIALTIDPQDQVSLTESKKLDERIKQAVSDRLARGQEALKRNLHLEARSHFLAVLALDPANRDAFAALQQRVREVRQVNHTVRAGESLASIAQQYYGDRSRSEVIWETNQLPPNPKLTPGMILKIPEIPGLPLRSVEPPAAARPRPESTSPALKAEPAEETPYVNPALAEAKEELEKGEYVSALSIVDQFLGQNPRSNEALDLKRAVLLQQGKALLQQNKLNDSLTAFTQLAKLSPRDASVAAFVGNVRGRLIQQHYNQGIRLYREEKLAEAINEWRTVLQYDPKHDGAKKNIDTAERLLKSLKERQQKRGG